MKESLHEESRGIRALIIAVIFLLASTAADAGIQFNVDLSPFGWGPPPPPVVYEPPLITLPLPSSTMVMDIGEITIGTAMTNGGESGIIITTTIEGAMTTGNIDTDAWRFRPLSLLSCRNNVGCGALPQLLKDGPSRHL